MAWQCQQAVGSSWGSFNWCPFILVKVFQRCHDCMHSQWIKKQFSQRITSVYDRTPSAVYRSTVMATQMKPDKFVISSGY